MQDTWPAVKQAGILENYYVTLEKSDSIVSFIGLRTYTARV